MKVLVTIQHPAHVHFFRNAISELLDSGHEVMVCCRNKDIAVELLDAYDIEYEILAGDSSTFGELVKTQAVYESKLLARAIKFNPDVMTAISEPAVTHVSRLINSKSVIFVDTEHATLQNKLAFPFAHRICTPECYYDTIGSKQVSYPGYHELSYLHPNRFEPDPQIVREAGVDPHEKYAIVRSVAWKAAHDVGQKGFNSVADVVESLEETGASVVVSAEGDLPDVLEARCLEVPPEKMHHVMAFADVFIGESSTMAAESAVLGTPAIYVNSLRLGYIDELESRYGLVYHMTGENAQQNAVSRAVQILESEINFEEQRAELLEEKVDTTSTILKNIKDT